jgi:hypothetical protein
MIRFARLATCLAATAAIAGAFIPAAQAQDRRPLTITIQKRSYLDAGPVVPVGSMNRYATQHFYSSSAAPSFGNQSTLGLPGAIGSGSNPFANLF